MKGDDGMTENVMTLDSPFTKEAFRRIDAENLSMNELADRIRRGDRACMMRMYTILHDDLLAIAEKAISNARQAEFAVRKSFAEVFYDHENIDPDLFELNLIQVLTENTRKLNIRNTYTKALEKPISLKPKKVQHAEPMKVSVSGAGEGVLDYADAAAVGSDAGTLDRSRSGADENTHTRAIPVILSTAAAISGVGAGVNYVHTQKVKKAKAASYTQMMNALQISFATNDDGSEKNVFEYTPNAEQSVSDLVASHSGSLATSTNAIDLSHVGETLVTYSLSNTDSYAQTARTSVTRTYTVQDTQAPQITLSQDSVTLTEGDSFDPYSLVSAVADPADGALNRVDTAPEALTDDSEGRVYESGWYTVQSSVDTSKAGEYNVLIHASDNHGNVTEVSVPVTVKEKPTVNIVSTSSATVTATASVDTGSNVTTTYNLLTGTYGLSKAAACGIMANIQIESTFNPTAGSSYYGICQWGGSRLSNLTAFCAANGYSSSSLEGQIAFMISEMGSGMIATMNQVADSADGAAQAGVYFRTNFERSAGLNNVANIAASFYNSMS